MESDWDVIKSYFNSSKYRLTEHQLNSFDDFLLKKIPSVVRENNPFVMKKKLNGKDIEVRVYIGGKESDRIYFMKPTISIDGDEFDPLLPSICRNMGSVYDIEINVDVVVEVEDFKSKDVSTREFEKMVLGRIPTMLHSRMCYLRDRSDSEMIEFGEDPSDIGGYFIVDGKEKVVISQEQVAPNTVILRKKDDGMSVFFRSVSMETSVKPVEFEIFTKSEKDRRIFASVRAISKPVPISVLFRAIGMESDKDIVMSIVGDRYDNDEFSREKMMLMYFRQSLVDNPGVWTKDQAIDYIVPLTPYKTRDHALYILQRHLLPGAGNAGSMKSLELGRLVRRLLEGICGFTPFTDRESFKIKQVQLAGQMMADVFSDTYMNFKKGFRDALDRAFYFDAWNQTGNIRLIINNSNISKLMSNGSVITDIFYKSMKGKWGGKDNNGGIVQDLSRLSYIGFLSHLRRVNNPLDRNMKLAAPRRLHGSQWGSLCPVESPDGAGIGLLKNLAIMCTVTSDSDPKKVVNFLDEKQIRRAIQVSAEEAVNSTKVLVNGVWLCVIQVDKVSEFLTTVRDARNRGELGEFVSISYDMHFNEIQIYTNAGRCARPLYTRKAIAGKSWDDLIRGGMLEYIDVKEAENVLISMGRQEMTSKHTHSEIHPSTIFSVYSVTVPLLSHNPGNRNTLSAAQTKQGAGHFSSAFRLRGDAMAFSLDYPERPLVTTRYEKMIRQDTHPGGHNAIVAVMSFTGFNQEDAVILNRSSVERGIFKTSYFKTAVHREEVTAESRVYFDSTFKIDGISTSSIDENGFPHLNSYVEEDQPLVGIIAERYEGGEGEVDESDLLVSTSRQGTRKVIRNASPLADSSWVGSVVDNIVVNTTSGTIDAKPVRTCRVRYRKTRFPQLGDKFASRHAQKGVIGMMIPQIEMPYTEEGIVPDIIINPHAFPSRMTVGHLLESLLAKSAVVTGDPVDATMFEDPGVSSAEQALDKFGYHRFGDEVLYNPSTGMPIENAVFFTPMFYQRLKHMSQDKVKARQSGRVSAISRQPTGTVGSEKPLKIGEMESAAILGHGQSAFFRESSMNKSDSTGVWVDEEGHKIAYNEKIGRFIGIRDESSTVFKKHEIPYAFNVMQHECGGLGIGVSLNSDDSFDRDGMQDEISSEDDADNDSLDNNSSD